MKRLVHIFKFLLILLVALGLVYTFFVLINADLYRNDNNIISISEDARVKVAENSYQGSVSGNIVSMSNGVIKLADKMTGDNLEYGYFDETEIYIEDPYTAEYSQVSVDELLQRYDFSLNNGYAADVNYEYIEDQSNVKNILVRPYTKFTGNIVGVQGDVYELSVLDSEETIEFVVDDQTVLGKISGGARLDGDLSALHSLSSEVRVEVIVIDSNSYLASRILIYDI